MSRTLVSRRFVGGLIVAAGLACPASASAAGLDVSRFAASPSPIKVHKFRASPIKDGVLSARVYVLNRGRRYAPGARVVLGLSTDPKVDPGDTRLDPPRPLRNLRSRRLVQVRMAARVPATIPRGAKYAFACVVVPRSTNPESRPVGVARASGNPATGILDCKMGALAAQEAAWDWSVPARYGGLDQDGDGKVDAVPPDSPRNSESAPKVVPPLWPVKLKASRCSAGDGKARHWVVNGGEVISGSATECELTYGFPAEGDYDVALQDLDPATGAVRDTDPRTVTVDDTLIVSLGDSLASGEGAPEVEGKGRRGWQDGGDCHRSANAGPARAARALEEADDKTTVTFVHLACSGATIGRGKSVASQLAQMATLTKAGETKARKVDAVMLSIGANDVGFADIANECFQHNCLAPTNSTVADAKKAWEALPGGYKELAGELKGAGINANQVLLTEYPDPLRDDEGNVCQDIQFWHEGAMRVLTEDEAQWASGTLLPRINAAGKTAARKHHWKRVGGMAKSFRSHGYCARDSWITQGPESKTKQGDIDGTLHPNALGHKLGYAPPLTDALNRLLHPQPRTPR